MKMKILPFLWNYGPARMLCLSCAMTFLAGCDSCVSVKTHTTESEVGTATIILNNLNQLAGPGEKKFVAVAFTGTQSNGSSDKGVTSFTFQKTYEVTSTSVVPVPTATRYDLKPGDWAVTVSTGTWSANCTKHIAKNTNSTFTFSYNQSGCQ